MANTVDGREVTEETIKAMINREYMFYFKREGVVPNIYRPERMFQMPTLNNINRKFNLNFSS